MSCVTLLGAHLLLSLGCIILEVAQCGLALTISKEKNYVNDRKHPGHLFLGQMSCEEWYSCAMVGKKAVKPTNRLLRVPVAITESENNDLLH